MFEQWRAERATTALKPVKELSMFERATADLHEKHLQMDVTSKMWKKFHTAQAHMAYAYRATVEQSSPLESTQDLQLGQSAVWDGVQTTVLDCDDRELAATPKSSQHLPATKSSQHLPATPLAAAKQTPAAQKLDDTLDDLLECGSMLSGMGDLLSSEDTIPNLLSMSPCAEEGRSDMNGNGASDNVVWDELSIDELFGTPSPQTQAASSMSYTAELDPFSDYFSGSTAQSVRQADVDVFGSILASSNTEKERVAVDDTADLMDLLQM